jgi:hypothetical protein
MHCVRRFRQRHVNYFHVILNATRRLRPQRLIQMRFVSDWPYGIYGGTTSRSSHNTQSVTRPEATRLAPHTWVAADERVNYEHFGNTASVETLDYVTVSVRQLEKSPAWLSRHTPVDRKRRCSSSSQPCIHTQQVRPLGSPAACRQTVMYLRSATDYVSRCFLPMQML